MLALPAAVHYLIQGNSVQCHFCGRGNPALLLPFVCLITHCCLISDRDWHSNPCDNKLHTLALIYGRVRLLLPPSCSSCPVRLSRCYVFARR